MPKLQRPDGVEIHWETRGEGPGVIHCSGYMAFPGVFSALHDDLARDHTLITYHLRGSGESSRRGPYDFATDEADLENVLEAAGGAAVAVALADGANRAVRVAAGRPDLLGSVVCPGGNPVGREATRDTDALTSSESVLEALVEMMSNDYRGTTRALVTDTNPQMSEDEIRARVNAQVEHIDHEAALERLRAWIDDNALEEGRALGDRLWLLQHAGNPWFPVEMLRRTAELLPDAHLIEAEDGPISRPDITAGVVRQITASVRVDAHAQTA